MGSHSYFYKSLSNPVSSCLMFAIFGFHQINRKLDFISYVMIRCQCRSVQIIWFYSIFSQLYSTFLQCFLAKWKSALLFKLRKISSDDFLPWHSVECWPICATRMVGDKAWNQWNHGTSAKPWNSWIWAFYHRWGIQTKSSIKLLTALLKVTKFSSLIIKRECPLQLSWSASLALSWRQRTSHGNLMIVSHQ
jgi:hypothetical protein